MALKRIILIGLSLIVLVACQPQSTSTLLPKSLVPTAAELVAPAQLPETPIPASTLEYPPTSTVFPKANPTHPPTWTPFATRSTSTPAVMGVFKFAADVDPLTGLKVADPEILNRRPVMVKVTNFPSDARPQAGLSKADVVFEYYIGEFMNRFLAVFYGKDAEKAGPIRSGRLVDAQLVNMYGGLLVYGSADVKVDGVLIQTLGERAISFLEAPCPAVCGTDTHASTVFTNTAELTRFAKKDAINDSRPDLSGMIFDARVPQSDQMAVKIAVQYVKFYRGEWEYDPDTHLYLRWIDDDSIKVPPVMVPLKDRLNDKQLAFSNLVLIFANYTEFAPTLHEIDIWKNTTGERAIFFRDGVMTEGTWRSVGYDRPIQFFNHYGIPYALKPGNTWIVIVGNSSKFEQPASGQWELRFDLP